MVIETIQKDRPNTWCRNTQRVTWWVFKCCHFQWCWVSRSSNL